MSDGSYSLVLYKEPLHYQDTSGNWQDIDNSFSISSSTTSAVEQDNITDSASTNSEASVDSQNAVNSSSSLEHGTSEDNQSTAVNSKSAIDSSSNSFNLVDSKAAQDNQELENKAAKSKIKLSTKLKSGKTVTIKKDGYTLKWGLDGANTVKSHIVTHDDSNLVQNQINQLLTVKMLKAK